MKITAMYLEEPGEIVPRQIDMSRIGKDEVLVKIKDMVQTSEKGNLEVPLWRCKPSSP